MPFHRLVERVLLLGEDAPLAVPPVQGLAQGAPAPERLRALVDAVAPARAGFDARAVAFGHRYRSGFWGIYLLSALAVLCAVLPLALGWDSPAHAMHPFAGAWAAAEVAVIALVVAIYRRGHGRDWQGEWLRARAIAERSAYLALLAPVLDFAAGAGEQDWYARALGTAARSRGVGEIAHLCARLEPIARTALQDAWEDEGFVRELGAWATAVLADQREYHLCVARRQHALQHRVHRITVALFVATALCALAHLAVHSFWLSVLTTFLPALGAALHGALAQSEAHRIGANSRRVAASLAAPMEAIARAAALAPGAARRDEMRAAIGAAIALIVAEHEDWHALVQPHQLPLP
jgi:hypothetical protein